jgi:hypothetical protein
MKQFYSLILFLFILFSSCGGPAKSSDYDQIAIEVCNCMKPLSQIYGDFKRAIDENDLQALDNLADELEQANESVDECAEAIEEKYGALEGAREEAVKIAMKTQCPNIIKILNEVESDLTQ